MADVPIIDTSKKIRISKNMLRGFANGERLFCASLSILVLGIE
jgi:hypothetical protein